MTHEDLDLDDELLIVAGMIKKYNLKKVNKKKWSMCCPFHIEKTPSFVLDNLTGTFFCYGCGKKGDWADLVAVKERFL